MAHVHATHLSNKLPIHCLSLRVVEIDIEYHRDLVSSYCDTEIRYWIELPLLASDYVITLESNIAKGEQANSNCIHSR